MAAVRRMASAKVTPHGRRQRVLQFLTSTLIAEYELSVMSIGGSSGSDPTITAAEFGEYEAAGDVRYVLVSSGGQGGGFGRGGAGGATTLPNGAGAGIPGTSSTAAGVNAVMSAVQAVCEPVN